METKVSAARRRRRRLVRTALLALPAGLATLLACGPPRLSPGVWLADDGTQQYVLAFERTAGLVSGTMHHLVAGKQVRMWGFAGTLTRAGSLNLSWGTNNSMNAVVDLELGEIDGTVRMANGEVFGGVFRHREAAGIPGLAALPELPYQLRPPAPGSGWEIAEPAAVGLSPRHLETTVRAVTRGEAGLLHSLLVVRHGKLVIEEYFHGYRREDLHEIGSVTKSVASLLVGIAHDRDTISGLDTSVLEWFPEHAAEMEPGWNRVTLAHILTMTAGLAWDRREDLPDPATGPALFRQLTKRRVADEPGSRWLYNDWDVELLGGVLRRVTGMQADEFAAQTLFAPLEITAWDWERGKMEGYPSLAGTLQLRPLDLAKIGQLVLDGGRWQGRQVVSEEWIEESTAARVATHRGAERYGYLWHRDDAPLDAGPFPILLASGWGSQLIHVVPALDAVIVTTGGNHLSGKTFAIGGVLLRRLVPGIER